MKAWTLLTAVALLVAGAPADSGVAAAPAVRQALELIQKTESRLIEEQIRICEIPAPPFKEQERAGYLKRRFAELGLQNVRIDPEGNVIGERPGAGWNPALVVSAHLDTVFPEGTDVSVQRRGSVLRGPGIGDDCRGLAVILGVAGALKESGVRTKGTILFVATVGEEGLGNLRGVRHLFSGQLKGRITHFISIDGTGLSAAHRAVGSNRYQVTFRGPGGHSYGAFGLASPIHALGRAVEKISRFRVPADPKTTFNVGRIEGGTSINSIAHTAWMEVDMRSESAAELAKLDAAFRRAVQEALDEENAFWANGPKLTVEVKSVGERPTGEQSPDSPIIRAVRAADAALGITTQLRSGSTDSNIPISLGIPAVTLSGGGRGTGAHSLDESFDTTNSHLGTQRALLVALEIAGLR